MNSIVLTANVQPNLDVNYIGMDVHSDNVVVCVRRNTINSSGQLVGKTIKTKKVVIKNSQEPLVELLSKYADGRQHIMTAESTFNWYWLADIAEDHGWNFRLADPCTVSQANIKAANDETDAEYLADRLRTGSLKSTSVLPRQLRGVRDLMRHRLRVMQEVSDKKVRLSNLYHNHCAHPMHGKLLAALQDAYDEINIDAVLESGICNNGSELIIGDLLTGLREAETRLAKIEAAVYARIDEVDSYKAERMLLKTSMERLRRRTLGDYRHGNRRYFPLPHDGGLCVLLSTGTDVEAVQREKQGARQRQERQRLSQLGFDRIGDVDGAVQRADSTVLGTQAGKDGTARRRREGARRQTSALCVPGSAEKGVIRPGAGFWQQAHARSDDGRGRGSADTARTCITTRPCSGR